MAFSGLPIQAGHGPAPAYESVYILAKAFESAQTLDPDGVAAALEATDRRGVMGRLMFHRGRHLRRESSKGCFGLCGPVAGTRQTGRHLPPDRRRWANNFAILHETHKTVSLKLIPLLFLTRFYFRHLW
ncbi:conserved hypothetical protein [delta proteobacterium NaphS2]|nr:conserved hypothetical protein [delta proteobacterium NaphS2]